MKLEAAPLTPRANVDTVVAVAPAALGSLSVPKPEVAVKLWITGKLSESLQRQIANLASSRDVVRMAIMPDVHEGLQVPNGVVVATRNLVYPAMVGADIGCGVSGIRFNAQADSLSRGKLEDLLARMQRAVPTLKAPVHLAPEKLPETCELGTLSDDRLNREARREGRLQLGTLGRGNHFIELERDQGGYLWAIVHTGSRAMGQVITDFHLANAHKDGQSGLAYLDVLDTKGVGHPICYRKPLVDIKSYSGPP